MKGGVPVECKNFLKDITTNPTLECISKIKKLFGDSLKKPPIWRGPFAWSVLSTINAVDKPDNILGEVAWIAAQVVHGLESKLTVEKYDFDRLLCSVAAKLLESNEYTWSCCLTSLLYERLRVVSSEIDEDFDQLALGSKFLRRIPQLLFKKPSSDDTEFELLSVYCLLFWIRLYVNTEEFTLDLVKDCLMHVMTIASFQKSLEIAFYHLRQIIHTLLLRHSDHPINIVKIEDNVFSLLEQGKKFDEKIVQRARWKNLMSYLNSKEYRQDLEYLWIFDLSSLNDAEEYLPRLDTLPMSNLQNVLINWKRLSHVDRLILQLFLIHKATDNESTLITTTFEVSSSVELWISQYCGRQLGKSSNYVIANHYLVTFFNHLGTIRHIQTMKLYETCIKLLSQEANILQWNDFVKAITRFLKLGRYFSREEEALKVVLGCTKARILNNQPDEAIQILQCCTTYTFSEFDSIISDTWAILLGRLEIDTLLPNDDENLTINIVKKIPQRCIQALSVLKRICAKSLSLKVKLECHNAAIRCKISSEEALQWSAIAQQQYSDTIPGEIRTGFLGFVLVWKYLAKQKIGDDNVQELKNVPSSSLPDPVCLLSKLLLLDPTERKTLPIQELLTKDCSLDEEAPMVLLCQGRIIASHQEASRQFQFILSEIKSGKHTICELWNYYCRLFDIIDWLVYFCNLVGFFRLAKYYLKIACTYAESLRLSNRHQQYIHEQSLANIKGNNEFPDLKDFKNDLCLPTSVWDLCHWFDSQCMIDPLSLKDLVIFSTTKGSPSTLQSSTTALDWAWKCGSGFHFRQIVCKELLNLANPLDIMALISLVRKKEFLMETVELGTFEKEYHDACINTRTSHSVSLFVDIERNLMYFCRGNVPGIDGAIVARIKNESCTIKDIFKNLQMIVEDNKNALFKPGTVPIDDLSKRAWWQGRYELETRMKQLIEQLNGWLIMVAPIFGDNNGGKTTNLESVSNLGSVSGPEGVCLDTLLGSLKRSKGLERLSTVKFFEALDFHVDDVNLIADYLDCHSCNDDEEEEEEEELNPFVSKSPLQNDPFVLVIDRYLHNFPWEACGLFRNRSIVRSLGLKDSKLVNSHQKVEAISAILNPSGDLKRTEEQLFPLVNELSMQRIITGRPPTKVEMKRILTESDLALYFGHGSGEIYLSSQEISQLSQCAVTFLFGCSSGRLQRTGTYNPDGALLAFHTAGSPLLLVNLWDVTDRDIDKLTLSFLRDLQLPGALSIDCYSEALEKSRKCCLLRFLNGAAPVLYV